MADLSKKALRKSMIQKRLHMDKEEALKMSDIIFSKVLGLTEYKKAQRIMLYSSINNEVYTHDIINDIKKTGRQAFLPVLVSNTDMKAVLDTGEYSENKYGIKEPKGEFFESDIDLIICPAVAYDTSLNRIGYGGGYYDRFLKKHPRSIKIGIAYDYQIVDDVHNGKFDVPVDILISEKRILINENYKRKL